MRLQSLALQMIASNYKHSARKHTSPCKEAGIEEGFEKGEALKSFDIARDLLSMNLPIAQVMQDTGLTKEQIESLKN